MKNFIGSPNRYTHSMYLALIAGGQILKTIIKKTLGLSSTDGLSIFEFEDRKQASKTLKDEINLLDLTIEQKNRIISEKIRCFSFNNKIANQVRPTFTSYKRLVTLIFYLLFVLLLFCLVVYLLFKYLNR